MKIPSFLGFVKILSVNADPLPAYSLIAPCFVRTVFFCTFADVEIRLGIPGYV